MRRGFAPPIALPPHAAIVGMTLPATRRASGLGLHVGVPVSQSAFSVALGTRDVVATAWRRANRAFPGIATWVDP